MASAITQSSVATVVEDLVSDRNIALKICMIILNCLQIISSWIAVCFFFSDIQEWTPIEVGVSGGFLIFGNYIVAGICNGVIYWRRWNRSTKSYRRRIEEENKQAWACLRISLSLLGIPTVGRYIETIMVSRKLEELEKKHLHDSVNTHREGSQLNPVGTSKLGSIINQKYQKMPRNGSNPTMTSGASQLSINGMNETSQEKVRRAKRQYKRCEHDGALMALIAGATGAGPFTIALAVLYLQRIEKTRIPTEQGAAIIVSAILNILWLSATLTHFYPARHVLSEAEFERGVRSSNIGSIILLYFSHLVQVVLRIICFSVFANWFYAYVLIIVVFHWIVCLIIQLTYHISMKNKTVGQPMVSCGAFLSASFYAYVGLFDFVNGNQGKTRLRYLIYYAFYYIENICMLVIWIILNPITQIQFPIPFVCAVLALFWLGFFMLQMYLYYFSYSPYGSSIFGWCHKDKNRRKSMNYAEEVRDPVFGVPLAQSAVPLWQRQNSNPNNVPSSRISGISTQNPKYPKPMNLDTRHTPSIMSIPSVKTPPSILSQTPSNMKNEKPRFNPSLKPPPVIEHKSKKEIAKPKPKQQNSSSSSDDDEFQKYNPKPVIESPSHTNRSQSSSSDQSLPITRSQIINSPNNNDEIKPQPAKPLTTNPLVSKSMDSIPYVIPAMAPTNTHTKPIGGVNKPPRKSPHQKHRSVERPRNPHQHNRNSNYLHPNTIRNIR